MNVSIADVKVLATADDGEAVMNATLRGKTCGAPVSKHVEDLLFEGSVVEVDCQKCGARLRIERDELDALIESLPLIQL